jgi:ABC-type nitrate/sulfonate/bicarbonate transport system substrate-binding protein
MDSPHSDIFHILVCLRESARRGDWEGVACLAAALPQKTLPANPEELGAHLRALKDALSVAKDSRAHAAASLGRLNAAARFNHARSDSA